MWNELKKKRERIKNCIVYFCTQGYWMQKEKQCAKNNENGTHFRYLSTAHIKNININDTRLEKEMFAALSYTHKQPQYSTTTPLN